MKQKFGKDRRWQSALVAVLMLGVTACGAAKANSTPTVSVEEIFTSAAQTFEAQQATDIALTPPTETPMPTPLPTLAAPTLPPLPLATISFGTPTVDAGSAPGCDNSAFIGDITIPDGTKMDPDQNFKKTWRMFNNGTCPWDSTYQLVYVDGDKMGGANLHMPLTIPPGQLIDLTIDMQAPSDYGDYKGNWRMQNGNGKHFGSQVYVSIKVRLGNVADTATATP